MKTYFLSPPALVFAAALLLAAPALHPSPFTGSWKLNLAKSKFSPGPPFRSFIITFTPDGTRHLHLVGPAGQQVNAELPWSDGKEVSVKGMDSTVAASTIEGRTFHDTWKQNGKVIEDVHGILSQVARTLKTTVDGTDNRGYSYHNELTFDKSEIPQ